MQTGLGLMYISQTFQDKGRCLDSADSSSCRVEHVLILRHPGFSQDIPRNNIGGLIILIRIGFGGHYTVIIIRNHQNSIGNY